MHERHGTATASELASIRKDDEGGDQDEGGKGASSYASAMLCSHIASRDLHPSSSRRLHTRRNTTTALPSQLTLPLLVDDAAEGDAGEGENAGPEDSHLKLWSDKHIVNNWLATAIYIGENRGMARSMAQLAAQSEAPATAQMEKVR